ncbi:MAG: hypothetical protein ACPGUV_14500, partial [Polyangiales bacterium]
MAAAHRRELGHLRIVVLQAAAVLAAVYLVPGLERWRPWQGGASWPLASLWQGWQKEMRLPAFA